MPTATRDAPGAEQIAARRTRSRRPPMPITGIADRARQPRRPVAGRRCAPPARRGRRRPPRASARRSCGSSAVALIVLISETASAPPCSAARGDQRRVGDVRRQLHDQRLRGQRPERLEQRQRLGRLLADDQPRVHVRAGDVELQRRDLRAAARPPRSASRTPRRWSPSPRRSAAPAASTSCGRSCSRKPSRPLFGSPIELIIPAALLPQPRRRVAGPRRGRDRLRDEGAEGKPLEQLLAEHPPGGDRVEGPRPVDDRVRESIPQNSSGDALIRRPPAAHR